MQVNRREKYSGGSVGHWGEFPECCAELVLRKAQN